MARDLRSTLARIGSAPGLLQWRKRRFDKRFESGGAMGCFRGIYASQAEAAAAAPMTRPLGYDHPAAANMYHDRLNRVFPSDYPMMFWLQKAFDDGVRNVFDLGGHIGIDYYAYQPLVNYPEGLCWTVHDLPAVLEAGRREAQARDAARRLTFADDAGLAAKTDLLFTSGCLQYLSDTLAQRLAALPRRPRWLLINHLPLHPDRTYWTLQSLDTAFCPYWIQHERRFMSDIAGLGYRTLDVWENADKACWIAFEPEHSLDRYHGMAFKLG